MHGVYSMIVERAKNCHKFKRFEVKSSIQTSNFGGFRSTVQAKPHKNQVKSRWANIMHGSLELWFTIINPCCRVLPSKSGGKVR